MLDGFDPRPAAREFWALAEIDEPFPRRLLEPVTVALPVSVVHLARLHLGAAASWLAARGVTGFSVECDRPVRGCLVAGRGHAFIFVEGAAPETEARYTFAHEVAHFLYHYRRPRERALSLLGPSVRAVLDGEREALLEERWASVLRGVPLGVYSHTLERDEDGFADAATAAIEREADLLALELLAPSALVRATPAGAPRVEALTTRFGLPRREAERWARWIESHHGEDPLVARWTKALSENRPGRVEEGGGTDEPPR